MKIPTTEQVLEEIADFRKRHGDMSKTRFGALATGEPQLIESIANGRSPSLNLMLRISDFMKAEDQKLADASPGKRGDFTDTGKAPAC